MINMIEKKKLYGNYKKLQDIYDTEGVLSTRFYGQCIAYVKTVLNKYLIQKQFSEDNINDCFIAIYEKVIKNYDPNKGCLGTFIYTIIRNYCTKVNYKLVNHQKPISLDFEYIDKEQLRDSEFDSYSEEESKENSVELDSVENYCSSLSCEDMYDTIEYYHDLFNEYSNLKELRDCDIDKLNKLDAVRKDLLWNVWKKSIQF
jgi:hypothetical protein